MIYEVTNESKEFQDPKLVKDSYIDGTIKR